MSQIKGNKGEWSELYAFVKLLSLGKLYAADANVRQLNDFYFSILAILREEFPNILSKYQIDNKLSTVEIYLNNKMVDSVSMDELNTWADELFWGIRNANQASFEIPISCSIMSKLHCCKLKAPSRDKADIVMDLHDPKVGFNHVCGFSIKSDVGHPPTLLNASKATNFIYEVSGITDEIVESINNIEGSSKIISRIRSIYERGGKLTFVKTANATFEGNLMFIDSMMPRIMGELVRYSYCTNEKDMVRIGNYFETTNPLGDVHPSGFYNYKIKEFLCAIALGMVPDTPWKGVDDANGGYIIVTLTGDVLAYHIYNRDAFKQYLLKNTVLERASTGRHNYASIYKGKDGKKYMNLNLQIRFRPIL